MTFQTSFKNSFQSKNNFQLSNFQFFTEYLWNKGQSKKKMEKNDENNCLIVFHSGQFLDVNVKTKGISSLYFGGSLRPLTLLIKSRKL